VNWRIHIALIICLTAAKATAEEFSISDSEDPIVGADIQVTPEKLVLGQEAEAEIRIELLGALENTAACKNIQVRVNTGEIRQVFRVAPGVFTAQYQLPKEFYPQFALITVYAFCDGREIVGFCAHPLYGSGEVTVQSKPFTKVSLNIAGNSFGPMSTDETGRVNIPVVVRPGIFTGTAGDKIIDLNLPPVKRLVAFTVPQRVAADSESGAVLWIYAIDKAGKPLSVPNIVVDAARGHLSRIESVAPGIVRARYLPPAKVDDGKDSVVVSLSSDAASMETLEMEIYPGQAAQVSATVTPNSHIASSTDPVTVFARVFDNKGNAASAKLTAVSNLGDLTAKISSTPGEYRWTLALPAHFRGKRRAEVSVYSREGRRLKSVARVDLVAGEPVSMSVIPPDGSVSSDGYTAVPIRISVVDRSANPVGGLHLEVSSDVGTLSPLREDENAEYVMGFTPPLQRKEGKAIIAAKIDSARTKAAVLLTPRFYRIALIPEVGYFNNIGNINAPMFSVAADVSLWKIVSGLNTGVDVKYTFSHVDNKDGASSTIHIFPIIGFVGYHFTVIPRLQADFSTGIGPVAVSSVLSLQNAYTEKSQAVELGVSVSLGAALRVGVGHATFRLQYIFAKSTKIDSLSGMLGGLALMVGYRFKLM
jgi:hypothetical protein